MSELHANTDSILDSGQKIQNLRDDVERIKGGIQGCLDEMNTEAMTGTALDPKTEAQARQDMADLDKLLEQEGEMGSHWSFTGDTIEEAGENAASAFNG